MKTLLLILALATFGYSQECEHKDTIDRFDDLRITAPARITMISGTTLTYSITDRLEVRVRELKMTAKTEIPKDVYKLDPKKLWFIIWCSRHDVAYQIQPYTPKN